MRKSSLESQLNPIIKADYPDPDVICVDDTYYMISTTMYFMPGGVILRSYDLVNWEIASYVFDKLDDNENERLERESTAYGGGMWAASLRYHDSKFYVVFISRFTNTTYLFISDNINGPWEKRTIEGCYHDCSLLFDDDGRKYLVSGNTNIRLVELEDDLSKPKKGGIDKIIIKDETDDILKYEGSHFYKINGRYYIFLIKWQKAEPSRRVEYCFVSDTIDGEYEGKLVLNDDRGYMNQGVAQGGIVMAPNGKWYAMLFQDSGAVGRMPVLVPVSFDDRFPVFGVDGKVPEKFEYASSRPYYRYEPLFTSDNFILEEGKDSYASLKKQWQFNHQPDLNNFELLPEGGLRLRTSKICSNLPHSRNTLTQRMRFPKCEAEVTIDASGMKNGDIAGLCALQGCYGYLGIMKEAGAYYLVKTIRKLESNPYAVGASGDFVPGSVVEKIKLSDSKITVCLKANFENMTDKLDFYYLKDGKFVKVSNSHQLEFRLDHFTGARFGLFLFATRETGGEVLFKEFIYRS